MMSCFEQSRARLVGSSENGQHRTLSVLTKVQPCQIEGREQLHLRISIRRKINEPRNNLETSVKNSIDKFLF